MRVRTNANAWVLLVIAAGFGLLAVAATRAESAPLLTLALLGAAVVVTELMEVEHDSPSLDPLEAHRFSFSSGVHIAAVLLVGPWAAAVVAAGGVLASDGLRGAQPRRVAYNASVFALATLAGGLVFEALGGTPGTLALPAQLPAVAALAATAFAVNTLLISAVVSFSSGIPLVPLEREKLETEIPTLAAEAGLGLALAVLAEREPWAIVALAPLVYGVYQAHARLATLRSETTRALEAFANLVDERDPSTFRHSTRVAELVGRLGHSLRLPGSQVARLRWAGRLHDLGKIAVDSTSLRRPYDLSEEEWALMHRHPRLSARLLRRFRLAVAEARAIEYHHERYDGLGYYGIAGTEIPLAAHFLIVADSYDAMVTDRPYRRGLSREHALAEIEKAAGTQFHPAVAKAFVALQRGLDPRSVLSPAELAELQTTTVPTGRRRKSAERVLHGPHTMRFAALVFALLALGLHWYVVAGIGFVVLAASVASAVFEPRRVRGLAAQLEAAVQGSGPFEGLLEELGRMGGGVRWAALVAWHESQLTGSIGMACGDARAAPTETAVTSWLVRDADLGDRILETEGALGRGNVHVAVPLHDGDAVAAYLVLQLDKRLPRRTKAAVRLASETLEQALVPLAAAGAKRAPALAAAR